jgi:thiamine-phosphate pyrophosphorylase
MHTAAFRRLPNRGLYVITPGPRADLLDACHAAVRAGARLLQYRDKSRDAARRREEAAALAALCTRYGVPLIINDDIELAATVAAAGVHLGADDPAIAAARARVGADAIVGVSCYDSLERARDACLQGADYLAFGAFYPSASKPHARRATPELLEAAKSLGRPLVAIGGITADNAAPLLDAGADFLAVITGVFSTGDAFAAAQRYAQLFQK